MHQQQNKIRGPGCGCILRKKKKKLPKRVEFLKNMDLLVRKYTAIVVNGSVALE